jgi:hypothetical protein
MTEYLQVQYRRGKKARKRWGGEVRYVEEGKYEL